MLWGKTFPFKLVYSDAYWMTDFGQHIFPVKKYRLIYEKLLYMGAKKENFLSPYPASEEDLLLVHTAKYIKKLETNTLSQSEIATMELPFSPKIMNFARLSVGGTVLAAEIAMEEGLSVHIGGGFHHAFSDHGEGFCILNDVAVALEKLRNNQKFNKAMVVDCDVHQGNGTASIFFKKNYAFTFSIHQMDIYPSQKAKSSVDVEMWSGDGDDKYLSKLFDYFPSLYKEIRPGLIFFLAGADPFEKDQLGSLNLSMDGLIKRDMIIIKEARKLNIPVVIVFGGGYAYDIKDTVAIHVNTIKIAQKIHRRFS